MYGDSAAVRVRLAAATQTGVAAADHRPTRETDILAGVRCMPGGDRSTQARVLGDRRRQHPVDPGRRPREGLTVRGGLSTERLRHRSRRSIEEARIGPPASVRAEVPRPPQVVQGLFDKCFRDLSWSADQPESTPARAHGRARGLSQREPDRRLPVPAAPALLPEGRVDVRPLRHRASSCRWRAGTTHTGLFEPMASRGRSRRRNPSVVVEAVWVTRMETSLPRRFEPNDLVRFHVG